MGSPSPPEGCGETLSAFFTLTASSPTMAERTPARSLESISRAECTCSILQEDESSLRYQRGCSERVESLQAESLSSSKAPLVNLELLTEALEWERLSQTS